MQSSRSANISLQNEINHRQQEENKVRQAAIARQQAESEAAAAARHRQEAELNAAAAAKERVETEHRLKKHCKDSLTQALRDSLAQVALEEQQAMQEVTKRVHAEGSKLRFHASMANQQLLANEHDALQRQKDTNAKREAELTLLGKHLPDEVPTSSLQIAAARSVAHLTPSENKKGKIVDDEEMDI